MYAKHRELIKTLISTGRNSYQQMWVAKDQQLFSFK